MAPRSVIPDPELGAPAEQGPGTQQTSTVSSTTTASSPHVLAADCNWYPPNAAQAQQEPGQPGESDLPGGSGSLFSMYLNKAEDDDRKTVEGWTRDAGGVLAFVSLSPISPIILCLT